MVVRDSFAVPTQISSCYFIVSYPNKTHTSLDDRRNTIYFLIGFSWLLLEQNQSNLEVS